MLRRVRNCRGIIIIIIITTATTIANNNNTHNNNHCFALFNIHACRFVLVGQKKIIIVIVIETTDQAVTEAAWHWPSVLSR